MNKQIKLRIDIAAHHTLNRHNIIITWRKDVKFTSDINSRQKHKLQVNEEQQVKIQQWN